MEHKGNEHVSVRQIDGNGPGIHHVSAYSDKDGSQSSVSNYGVIHEQTRVRRIFNFMQIFFLSLTFMSGWEVMALNIYSVFLNGGPQVFSWGILLVVVGALSQAASLAEMSSIQPIAGAQYHWTHFLAPHRFRNFITWMQAWITWFAWLSTLAGIVNTTALMLQGIVILNYPEFQFQSWHTTLVMYAILVFQVILNTHFFELIPWLELMSGVLHIALFIVYTVVLLTLSKHHKSEFVFFDRVNSSNTSGWDNSFITWNLGLLTPLWGFVGFDSATHLGEEVKKAKLAVPRVMFWTIALNGLLAYSFVLTILYSAGDISKALASPTYQPFLYIAQHVTGSTRIATAMGCGLLAISLSVNLASIASASRLTWAWARDGGLPVYFAKVSEKHRVPARAVVLSASVVAILALLNIPTTVAFQAFIALATLAISSSYLIAIGSMIYSRLQTSYEPVQLGQWNLGRYGLYINMLAFVFTLYMIIWLPFPNQLPVTAHNMNWAGPIFGFVIMIALALWFLRIVMGSRWQGPNLEIIREALKED